MSGGREYSSYQQGVINRYYQNIDTITIGKLSELVSELYVCENAGKAQTLWKNALSALKKTPIDPVRAGRIVAERNVKALADVVTELTNMKPGDVKKAPAAPVVTEAAATPAPPAASSAVATQAAAKPIEITPEMLKGALTAFKKRLKVTVLDDESKLSARALTGGRKSSIVGIVPPREYPREVWEELVKQGKLKNTGSGFYALADA